MLATTTTMKNITKIIQHKRPATCALWLHQWSRWGKIKRRREMSGTILEWAYRYQQRRCKNCNAMQERML